MKKSALTSCLLALSLALPVGVAGTVAFAPDAAVASPNDRGNGKSNRESRSRGSENRASRDRTDRPGQGAVRSELRWLNAANASPTARLNASPDSNVGRIAVYEQAARTTLALRDMVTEKEQDYVALRDSYDGPSSEELIAARDALDPLSPTYQADYDTLSTQIGQVEVHEAALAELGRQVLDLRDQRDAAETAEGETLLTLTGGRELSDAALAEFRRQLGL